MSYVKLLNSNTRRLKKKMGAREFDISLHPLHLIALSYAKRLYMSAKIAMKRCFNLWRFHIIYETYYKYDKKFIQNNSKSERTYCKIFCFIGTLSSKTPLKTFSCLLLHSFLLTLCKMLTAIFVVKIKLFFMDWFY